MSPDSRTPDPNGLDLPALDPHSLDRRSLDLRWAADLVLARRWLGLAVGVLLLAGLFAVLLVLGRTPPFDRLVGDPDWFRRCLVVHVVLSLVLWFQSFLAAALLGLPAHPTRGGLAAASPLLALAGLVMLGTSAWLPGTAPVMSNYVPMIDHPLFAAGLAAFGVGVLCVALSRRLLPTGDDRHALGMPASSMPFLRGVIVALFVAALTLLGSRANMTDGLTPATHYELLYWGAGHVLQLASALGMTAVWCWFAALITGRSPMSRGVAAMLTAIAVLPWLIAPLLPLGGTWTATYRDGFTHLMRWALLPAPLAAAALCVRALRAHRAPRTSAQRMLAVAFWASLGLTVLGLGLGASIRGANTMVPAHYHASIGAVTVAFMVGCLALMPVLGFRDATVHLPRAVRWQPTLYGVGQAVFALGFAFAGAQRKAYGAEQAGRDLTQTIGLVVMGVGGLMAVAGGITFLAIFLRNAWGRAAAAAPVPARASSS